jgi:chromosome segregation ATPase
MTPDENQRIGQLERAVAKMEQRVDDLSGAVKDLSPLSLAVARMEGTVARVVSDVSSLDLRLEEFERLLENKIDGVMALVSEDKQAREDRERAESERRSQERRDARRSRAALIVGCVAAILSPVGVIVAALISGGVS